MPDFFAPAPRGTENVLADELRELGLAEVVADLGGVAFGTSLEDAYRACLWSRTASRVLLPLSRFRASGAKQLYDGVHAIDWTRHLGPDNTLAVDVAGHRNAPAGPSHFVALKTKDAIVDRIRAAEGRRPSVDTSDPDLRIHVYLFDSEVTVSLDLAGEGLHHRGLGRAGGGAPLKENLAAAILRIAGWPSRAADGAPLVDPMCGSGTLLVEAGWMALDVAPGLQRERLGAEGWRGHDAALWRRLRDEAIARRAAGRARPLRLAGFDAAPSAVAAARRNLESAGLIGKNTVGKGAARGLDIRVQVGDLRDTASPWGDADPGLVVTNPPYGERLGVEGELGVLYTLLGDVLKRGFPGWSSWVLCGNPVLAKRIGLRAVRRHVLWNGPIECRLLDIPISAKPVESTDGPGWRRARSPEGSGFAKRLLKNRRGLKQWAEHRGLTAYRLYDTDMRQFNLSVDWYDGAARVEEYERPKQIDADEADRRLHEALQVVAETLEIDSADVHLRVRGRRAADEQHGRRAERGKFREVREGDLRYLVNLTDYLDTGLFLDDRLLRQEIRERAEGKHFLNLFAYTCTASVAAAVGGAATTTSVDLSNTYLDWGRRNFQINGFDPETIASDAHRFLRGDVLQWLERGRGRRYDLIFVAPPTLSKSKAMRRDFDIQRDHGWLLKECAKFLVPGGTMLFAVNLRDFELDPEGLGDLWIEEITEEITPKDFSRRPRIRAWRMDQ